MDKKEKILLWVMGCCGALLVACYIFVAIYYGIQKPKITTISPAPGITCYFRGQDSLGCVRDK